MRMSIWGIIIGGAAGAAMGGGAIGTLLGAAAGHFIQKSMATEPTPEDEEQQRQIAFTVAVIALSAKMAKVDGAVTRDEIAAFRERVPIPPEEVAGVGKFWDQAKQSPHGFEAYASEVAAVFGPKSNVLEQILDLLFYIAEADGDVTPKEKEYLANVAEIFGFTENDLNRMFAQYGEAIRQRPWEVLGVSKDISDEDLKKRWKELAKENHPDKLTADGMPDDFIESAKAKMAEINVAYETMVKMRKK